MEKKYLRLISRLMALVMLVMVVSGGNEGTVAANVDEGVVQTGQCGKDINWELDKTTGVLTITGSGEMYDVNYTFPSVTRSVVIEEGITSICPRAFYGLEIRDVSLPGSLESIGDYAFWGCQNLKEVELPKNLVNIGEFAFEKCTSLSMFTVSLYNDVYRAYEGVLYNHDMSELIIYPAAKQGWDVKIEKTVEKLGTYAFDFNQNIVRLTFPSALKSIDEESFFDMKMLEEFVVDESNADFCAADGVLYDKNKTTLLKYPVRKTDSMFVVPDGVSVIRENAFRNNKFIASLTLPDSVESIEYAAFYGCSELENLMVLNPNCRIDSTILPGTSLEGRLTVYGYANSTAGSYAAGHNYMFKALSEKEIKSIEVVSLPKKLKYAQGENFAGYGLVIRINYVDDTFSDRSMGYSIEGFDSSAPGKNTITVKYEGFETTFEIEIVEKTDYETIEGEGRHTVDIIENGKLCSSYFIPKASGTYNFTAQSDSDTIGYLYDSDGNLLMSDDDGAGDGDFLITYDMEEGKTYILSVGFYDKNETGSFVVDINLEAAQDDVILTTKQLSVAGYQIKYAYDESGKADITFRTLAKAPKAGEKLVINNKEYMIARHGIIYALDPDYSGVTENRKLSKDYSLLDADSSSIINGMEHYEGAMLYEGKNRTHGFVATEKGYIDSVPGGDLQENETYFVQTMKGMNNLMAHSIQFRVFAITTTGKIIYSESAWVTSVARIAANLYEQNKGLSKEEYDYLYDNILHSDILLKVKNENEKYPYYKSAPGQYEWGPMV